METAWGEVITTAPLTVRFNGTADADAVAVPLKDDAYSASVGHKVWLLKLGSRWMVGGRFS